MWNLIRSWAQKRRYRQQQSQIQTCGLYIFSERGLALPIIGTMVTFPEEPVLQQLSVNMLDAEAIGASIITALDYAKSKRTTTAIADYRPEAAKFLAHMERFRQSIGMAKRKFEQDVEYISVTREAGEISFEKNSRVHGRFAFKGATSPTHRSSVAATVSNMEMGNAVLRLGSSGSPRP